MLNKTFPAIITAFIFFLGSAFLVQCEQEDRSNNFEEEREELVSNMESLLSDMDDQIDELGDRIEAAGDEADEDLENAYEELRGDRSELEKAIDDVENASEDTWADVKRETESTYQSISSKFDEWGDDLEDLLQ